VFTEKKRNPTQERDETHSEREGSRLGQQKCGQAETDERENIARMGGGRAGSGSYQK